MACEIIGSSLFDRYIEKENPLIIDLRSEKDYMKKHIKGAVCINAEDLENAICMAEPELCGPVMFY